MKKSQLFGSVFAFLFIQLVTLTTANYLKAGLDQPLLDLIKTHHPAAKRSLASPASLDLMRIFRNPMRLSQPVYDSWRNSARLYYTLPHEPQELQ